MPSSTEIVVDLGFGDAGKGATVSSRSLARRPDFVFRWNGGHQAAHNVISPTGEHHCFNIFGSHTLNHPDVPTYLGPKVIFDPYMAQREHDRLKRRGSLLVDRRAVVVTPWHVAMNQFREIQRGGDVHGSCGMGIGDVREDELNDTRDLIRVSDLQGDPAKLRAKFLEIAVRKSNAAKAVFGSRLQTPAGLPDMVRLLLLSPEEREAVWDNWRRAVAGGFDQNAWKPAEPTVMSHASYVLGEGAQGILLDELVGFHPHTTWTDCTPAPARSLLEEAGLPQPAIIGVIRAHGCRHGAGPFPGEILNPDPELLKGEHNGTGPWQGKFRVGIFDMPLLRYARTVVGKLDELYVRHLDRLPERPKMITTYEGGTDKRLSAPRREFPADQALAMSTVLGKVLAEAVPAVVPTQNVEDLVWYIRDVAQCQRGENCYGPRGETK